ncbi:MAG TPA: toprim domain-containing protein [Gammaproteobacteria bacterium]|nr:toprim domain-containing protein [Gammaproteobacteria bacterium]
MSGLDGLLDVMAAARLPPPVPLVVDGKPHRFYVDGDRRGSKNGWYWIRDGRFPSATFGSWRTGEHHRWSAFEDGQSPMGDSDREALRIERDRRRAEERAEEHEQQQRAARRAGEIWMACADPDPEHPYLIAKSVAAHGLRQYRDLLVVPLRDVRGRIWSLQFVSPTGEKRFLRGGRVRALFHAIGRATPRTWLVEGYATGVSVHERFGERVCCAMNAGNLLPAGRAIARIWSPPALAIMADDDWRTTGNPGATKAREAADALGCDWYLPEFPAERPDWATDFNDAAQLAREVRS